jgi:hypothetical protein
MSSDRFVRDPHELARQTLDAVVVLPLDAATATVVGGAGPEVWASLREPRSITELVDSLGGPDGEPRATIERAIGRAVAQLLEAGAIRELA